MKARKYLITYKTCIVFFFPSISQTKSTQINFICYLVTLSISSSTSIFFLGLLFSTNSWSCPDFDKFCFILQFARLIRKQWRGLSWIITLYDAEFGFCALHLSYFPWFHVIFLIYGASDSNYLDIAIASLGFFILMQAVTGGLLLKLHFNTIFEYLQVSSSQCL